MHMPFTLLIHVYNVPKYIMYLDLPHHVLCNTARFRLQVHTLRVEQGIWSNSTSRASPVCDICDSNDIQDEKHVLFRKNRKRKTTQAVETLPTSIKEKSMPRAKATCIPFTKSNKRKKSMRIGRVTSSNPCPILLIRVEISLLKSAPGASKFVSILDRMSVKLPSKLGGFVRVKTKLFKRFQCVWGVDDPTHT
eukprot:1151310-Pelagomonas_calceolata.AAC.3